MLKAIKMIEMKKGFVTLSDIKRLQEAAAAVPAPLAEAA